MRKFWLLNPKDWFLIRQKKKRNKHNFGLFVLFTECGECPCGVIVKAMECGIAVSEFVLQLRYYVHFRANTIGKGMNSLILPAMGWIVLLLFFLENGFGIK